MAEEKKRPDTTPKPPTRIARLKDAVRHLKEGGTMAGPDIDDLYAFLEEDERVGRPDHMEAAPEKAHEKPPEEKAS